MYHVKRKSNHVIIIIIIIIMLLLLLFASMVILKCVYALLITEPDPTKLDSWVDPTYVLLCCRVYRSTGWGGPKK